MKLKIRKCTFETNSSSMHSFVVLKEGGKMTPENYQLKCKGSPNLEVLLDDEGYLYLTEFCWERRPFKICDSVFNKIRYCFGCVHLTSYDYAKNEVTKHYTLDGNKLNSDVPSFQKLINAINKYIPEFKGFKVELHDNIGPDPWFTWCIDEPCIDDTADFEDIIFNTKNICVCDGDEYCDFLELLVSKIINSEIIDTIDNQPITEYLESSGYCVNDKM